MGQGHIRLLRSIPGPQNDAKIVQEFCAKGDGFITALEPGHLLALNHVKPYDSEVEVLEFGKVVARFARLAGEEPRPLAGSAHIVGAIAEACEKLDSDSPFFASRLYHGLHRRLAETIDELAAWGFEPQALLNLALECPPTLKVKLNSIAGIWDAIESRLDQFGIELSYRHTRRCLGSDPDPDVTFPPCLVFLDGSLTPKHVEWLKWASASGAQLTVVAESIPSEAEIFPGGKLAEQMLGVAGVASGGCAPFVTSLFTGTVAEDPGVVIRQFAASDPLAEVEWALRQCLQLSADTPLPKLGIFVRNFDDYGPLIEAAAERLEIPVRMSRRTKLLSSGYLRSLLKLLDSLASEDVRTLEVLMKSSYFQFPRDSRSKLADELSTAFREGSWGRLESWSLSEEESYPFLKEALLWRREATSRPASLAVWRERVANLGNLFPSIQSRQILDRDTRAKHSFERAIGARASFMEQREMGFEEAIGILREISEDGEYTYPGGPFGVQVSNAYNGFAEVDHLFVLGMLEGVFPRRRTESPILTDADKQEICERRSVLFPLRNSFSNAKRERDIFTALCATPNVGLTFSYPGTTDERDNIPAFYLEEIKRAANLRVEEWSYSRSQLTPELSDCLSKRDRELKVALDQGLTIAPDEDLSLHVRQALLERQEGAFGARELRTAWECPFRHLAGDALRVFPDRDRRRWYELRGLPQRVQLIKQPTPEAAHAALSLLMLQELEEMRPRVAPAEWNLMRRGGERLIQDWVEREFRAREVWPKNSGSERAPVAFGEPGLRGDIPRAGKVHGSVAGISKMGPYKVVHMVESNTPEPDRKSILGLSDRDALFYGLHLMAAFEKGSALGLEIESMAGGRKLYLLPRLDEPPVTADVQHQLEVVGLASESEATSATEVFFEHVKNLIEQAAKAIREVDATAKPGDHCAFCDHGELCRRSAEFGETDSPFEGDDD